MEFKVGDKVRLKAERMEIVKGTQIKKFLKGDIFTVKFIDTYFNRISFEETGGWTWSSDWFEKVEEDPKPIHDEIYLSYVGDTTIAVHEKVGVAVRGKHDKEDRKIGILIAVMRALGFEKQSIDDVIDVLFDDFTTMEELTNEELLEEVKRRMR